MSRYYCAFCSSHYQYHKTSSDGVLMCGQCGEPLMIKPLINSRQIVGLIAALAFLTPLVIMIIFIIRDFTHEKAPKNSNPSILLTIK